MAVVVPAHDEQALLPGCLHSVLDSLRHFPRARRSSWWPTLPGRHGQRRQRLGALVLTVRARNVGRARAAGMAHALRHGPQGLWLATTDADSRVPRRWGGWQLRHARAGTDLLVGTVRVTDWAPRCTQVGERFEDRYRQGLTGAGHRHVHGANLGCAATAYERLGGFADLRHGEDHDLVERGRHMPCGSSPTPVARCGPAPAATAGPRTASPATSTPSKPACGPCRWSLSGRRGIARQRHGLRLS